jgi:competence ComEA-like helix-hairpin-helix protein
VTEQLGSGSDGLGASGLDRRHVAIAVIGALAAMVIVAYTHLREVGDGYERTHFISTQRINVNTADAATLALLPEIGPDRAEKIIAYRSQHGPLRGYPDLLHVTGIGEKTVERLVGHITFEDDVVPTVTDDGR